MEINFKIVLEINEEKPVVIIPVVDGKSLRRLPLGIEDARKLGNTLTSWADAAKTLEGE